jgi:hypothetical protein
MTKPCEQAYLPDSAEIIHFSIAEDGYGHIKVKTKDFKFTRFAEYSGQATYHPLSGTFDLDFVNPCTLKIAEITPNTDRELFSFEKKAKPADTSKYSTALNDAKNSKIVDLLKFIAVASTASCDHFPASRMESVTTAIVPRGQTGSGANTLVEYAENLDFRLNNNPNETAIHDLCQNLSYIRSITNPSFDGLEGVDILPSGKIIFEPQSGEKLYLFDPDNYSVVVAQIHEVKNNQGTISQSFIENPLTWKGELELRCLNFGMHRTNTDSLKFIPGSLIDVSELVKTMKNDHQAGGELPNNFYVSSGSWNPETLVIDLTVVNMSIKFVQFSFQGVGTILSSNRGVSLTGLESGEVELSMGHAGPVYKSRIS